VVQTWSLTRNAAELLGDAGAAEQHRAQALDRFTEIGAPEADDIRRLAGPAPAVTVSRRATAPGR
jgi:hypothetical protein